MLKVENLHKYFGPVKAVQDVSFEVRRGEIVGFLGPNGAGKTTTMKVITGYLQPTAGRVLVDGVDMADDPETTKARIGYVPEQFPLYEDMLVYDYLRFAAEIRRVDPAKRDERIRRCGELCGLHDVIGRPIRELSKGYRQRVGLTQALIPDPDILILDEPTDGLDPNQKVEIRNLIREVGKTKTVLLSTHILPEVQVTCDRVMIISDGRVVASGTPAELSAKQSGSATYHVAFAEPAAAVKDRLETVSGVRTVKAESARADEGSRFVIDARGGADLRPELFRAAVDAKFTLLELTRDTASLEDIFRRLTQN